MRIKDALSWGFETLFLKSESARLDAELLLCHVLKKPATFLLTHDSSVLGFWQLWRYKRLIEKRKKGVPVAYLVGHKEFYFLDFEVNKHVLIPRPDTEILVEAALSYAQKLKKPLLLDVGTGSGCIPISILKNCSGLHAMATDVSRHALHVAQRNARKHRVTSRIRFFHSDLLESVPHKFFKGRDVVVTANLPYIPTDFSLHSETRFEPSVALFGGEDGMDLYKKLMVQLQSLKPRAIFVELFEFQIAILDRHMPNYALKRTEKMTGQAKMLFLERKN